MWIICSKVMKHEIFTRPWGIPVDVLKAGNNLLPKSSAIANNSPLYHCNTGTSGLRATANTWADNKPLKEKKIYENL